MGVSLSTLQMDLLESCIDISFSPFFFPWFCRKTIHSPVLYLLNLFP